MARDSGVRRAILTSPSRLEVTLANVVNLLQSFLQMRHGVVSLLADDGIPDIAVGAGWSEGSDERYRMRLPQKAIDQIVATAMPLVAENIATHPAFSAADLDILGASDGARVSFIGVPIHVRDKVYGNLYLTEKRTGTFTVDDEEILTALAATAGVAIANARLFDETQRRQRWAQSSAEIMSSLVSGTSDEALTLLASRVNDLPDADLACVLLPRGPDDLVIAARNQSNDVLGEIASRDAVSGKVHASYLDFRGRTAPWSRVSIEAVLRARG